MTTLVLTRFRPDKPASGAALRNWQNIRALATLGPVDVVSVGVEDAAEAVHYVREWMPFSMGVRSAWESVRTRCWPLRPGVFPGVDAYHCRRVSRWLRSRVAKRDYDVAVIEGISVASYLSDLKRAGCRIVFDAHNVESVLQGAVASFRAGRHAPVMRRMRDQLLRRRMMHVERGVVLESDAVWACSASDALQLEHAYGAPSRRVTVVPNAVDVDAYRQLDGSTVADEWGRVPVTLVYPGLFAYYPNVDAAMRLIEGVLPAIRSRGYRARLILVGQEPTPEMVAATLRDPAVEVTGRVDSVVPYLNQPCVLALPITLGGGTRLKILEAFAAGAPVVSTAKGVEGIDAVDGEHLLIRESPDAIAAAAIELWRRPGLRRSLRNKALELVRNGYSYSVVAQRIARSLGVTPDGSGLDRCLDLPASPRPDLVS